MSSSQYYIVYLEPKPETESFKVWQSVVDTEDEVSKRAMEWAISLGGIGITHSTDLEGDLVLDGIAFPADVVLKGWNKCDRQPRHDVVFRYPSRTKTGKEWAEKLAEFNAAIPKRTEAMKTECLTDEPFLLLNSLWARSQLFDFVYPRRRFVLSIAVPNAEQYDVSKVPNYTELSERELNLVMEQHNVEARRRREEGGDD